MSSDSQSRRDRVSQTMGSMLLKGFKMLADSCPTCYNVLMQDKKGVIICVNCDSNKEIEPSTTTMEVEQYNNVTAVSGGTGDSYNKRKHSSGNGVSSKALQTAEEALYQEIKFAADILNMNNPLNISERLIHVQFIRECAEAIKSLQNIQM